jgi:hypothetical protein
MTDINVTVSDIRIQRGAGAPPSLNRGEPDLDESHDILRIGKLLGWSVFRDQVYVDAADAAVLAAAKAYADTHGGSGGGGGTIATPSVYSETPAGACDGDNTSFTLAHTPLATVLVFKNGVLLAEGDEYSTLGPSITMSEAPLTGDALRAYYFGQDGAQHVSTDYGTY